MSKERRYSQWRSLSGHEVLFTKIEEEDIGNIQYFNRMALRATQPKLHTMFCVLFLKSASLAAELMSFGHLGAAI